MAEGDPYYPVPRPENTELYKQYQALAEETVGRPLRGPARHLQVLQHGPGGGAGPLGLRPHRRPEALRGHPRRGAEAGGPGRSHPRQERRQSSVLAEATASLRGAQGGLEGARQKRQRGPEKSGPPRACGARRRYGSAAVGGLVPRGENFRRGIPRTGGGRSSAESRKDPGRLGRRPRDGLYSNEHVYGRAVLCFQFRLEL